MRWDLYDALTTLIGDLTLLVRDDGQAAPEDEIKTLTLAKLSEFMIDEGSLQAYLDTLYEPIGSGYTLQAACAAFNPADASNYYLASRFTIVPSAAVTSMKLYITKPGTIKRILVEFSCTIGSNEAAAIYIRVNDTTDVLVHSGVQLNVSPQYYLNDTLNVSVSLWDFITLKLVTPTWVTNPTALDINAVIYIE